MQHTGWWTLFGFQELLQLRCFEGIELGVGAIKGGHIARDGRVEWCTQSQRWQGQLDPTGPAVT